MGATALTWSPGAQRRTGDRAPPAAYPPPAPPYAGGEFAPAAIRLAGFAGAVLGWLPDTFWSATPAELAAIVRVLAGEDGTAPPDAQAIARLKEAFPDG